MKLFKRKPKPVEVDWRKEINKIAPLPFDWSAITAATTSFVVYYVEIQ